VEVQKFKKWGKLVKFTGKGCVLKMATARVVATVASRDPETDKRKGRGFSSAELKEANITKRLAKLMKIPVDSRRSTSYPENITILKGLPKPEIKKRVRKPKKEKVKVPKKKKAPKKKEQPAETPAKKPAKKATKKATKAVGKAAEKAPEKPAKVEKAPEKPAKVEKVVEKAAEPVVTPNEMEKLPKITPELIKKLADLGVDGLKKLAKEDAKELGKLLGTDTKTVKSWVEFAKKSQK
jgi:colicin import membrane protein